MGDRYIGVTETCYLMRKHRDTLFAWAERGDFPRPIRHCGRWYWDKVEVSEFLDRLRNRVKAEFAR